MLFVVLFNRQTKQYKERHTFSYERYYIMDNSKNTPQYFP
jgi:hypothetical protein